MDEQKNRENQSSEGLGVEHETTAEANEEAVEVVLEEIREGADHRIESAKLGAEQGVHYVEGAGGTKEEIERARSAGVDQEEGVHVAKEKLEESLGDIESEVETPPSETKEEQPARRIEIPKGNEQQVPFSLLVELIERRERIEAQLDNSEPRTTSQETDLRYKRAVLSELLDKRSVDLGELSRKLEERYGKLDRGILDNAFREIEGIRGVTGNYTETRGESVSGGMGPNEKPPTEGKKEKSLGGEKEQVFSEEGLLNRNFGKDTKEPAREEKAERKENPPEKEKEQEKKTEKKPEEKKEKPKTEEQQPVRREDPLKTEKADESPEVNAAQKQFHRAFQEAARAIEDRSRGQKESAKEKTSNSAPEGSLKERLAADPAFKSKWEKFSEGAGEFLESLAPKQNYAVPNMIDGVRVMFHGAIAKWELKSALKVKAKLEGAHHTAQSIEAKIKEHGIRLEKARERQGGTLDTKIALRAEMERLDLDAQLEKAKRRADKFQSNLEGRNQELAYFQNRRNEICNNVIERMNERLAPYDERLGEMTKSREQLGAEIRNFEERKKEFSEEIAKLEKESKNALFGFERQPIKENIKRIKSALKDTDHLLKDRIKAQRKIDKDIILDDAIARPWRDTRDKYARITKQGFEADTSAPRRKEEMPKRGRKHVGGTPRRKGTAEPYNEDTEKDAEDTDEEKEGAGAESGTEAEREWKTNELVGVWNGHFGSELSVNPEWFARITKLSGDSKITPHTFISALNSYKDELRREGKTTVSDKKFGSSLSMFESILKGKK